MIPEDSQVAGPPCMFESRQRVAEDNEQRCTHGRYRRHACPPHLCRGSSLEDSVNQGNQLKGFLSGYLFHSGGLPGK